MSNHPSTRTKVRALSPLDGLPTRPVVVILLICAVTLVVFRYHAFEVPLERDEGNYAYIGERLFSGGRLYVDLWDHQPPGAFVLFGATSAVFGREPEVFRWLAVVFSLFSFVLVFDVTRRIAGARAGILAAAVFAIVSSDPGTAGEGCNREIYMNTFVLAAWAAAMRAFNVGNLSENERRTVRVIWLVLAGAALGVASTFKTIVAVHWLLLTIWCAWSAARWATNRASATVRSIAAMALAPTLFWLCITLWFAADGRLSDYVEAVFRFNVDYASSSKNFFARFADFFTPPPRLHVFSGTMILWLGAALAVVALVIDAILHRRRESYGIVLLLLASYSAVCLPNQFWPHYYYLMIAPMTIVVAAGLARLAQRFPRVTYLPSGVLILGLAVTQYQVYLSQPPLGITDQRYSARDFWARGQAETVAKVTDPEDAIFVYGNDASIYYYANRRCASRYTMIGALHSRFPGSDRRRKIMLDELVAHRPRLILVVLGEETFPEWIEFLPTRYDVAGYDFRDGPRNDAVMMVLCDRDRPIESVDWDWKVDKAN